MLGIGNGQPLMETTVNGAYVLLPRDEDWSEIRDIAANLLSDSTKTASIISSPQKQVRISIQNGTEINGLAFRASQLLEGQGFEVVSVSNANARDVTKTVIYDLTKGKNDGSLESLKRFLDADISSENSGWIFETAEPKELTVESEGIRTGNDVAVDFLVTLVRTPPARKVFGMKSKQNKYPRVADGTRNVGKLPFQPSDRKQRRSCFAGAERRYKEGRLNGAAACIVIDTGGLKEAADDLTEAER